jgi:death-on-curing protein
LQKIGRCTSAPQKEFEKLTVDISENKLTRYPKYNKVCKKCDIDPEIIFISDFLKRKTRDIDKRYYSITFQQLRTILSSYGFYLENPHGNTIDVIKYEEKKIMFGFKKKEIQKKICQIGFPGWKSQVGKGAINTVRKATGLVPERGFDSQSFFKGADKMQALVDEYKGPLRRLADK